jgi:hypothetical protein
MRILIFFSLLFLSVTAPAQRTSNVADGAPSLSPSSVVIVNGEPFVNQKYVDLVAGSPYFIEEFQQGKLIGASGQEYPNLWIKLDLLSGKVLYRDSTGKEMSATTPLKSLVIYRPGAQPFYFMLTSTLPLLNGIRDPWVQVLFDGKTPLFKTWSKQITEKKGYGSATTEQTITTSERYWVMHNQKLLELGKLKNIPKLLADKQAELETFLKEKDDARQPLDERFIRVLDYYNYLHEQEAGK